MSSAKDRKAIPRGSCAGFGPHAYPLRRTIVTSFKKGPSIFPLERRTEMAMINIWYPKEIEEVELKQVTRRSGDKRERFQRVLMPGHGETVRRSVGRFSFSKPDSGGAQHQFSRGRWAEAYWGTFGASASGWDIRAERSMAMAAYAMTHVTTQRISAR
jgi:hypothetical protein